MHAYSAAKAGVHGLACVMANEYATQGIRVNVLVPGLIRTGLNAEILARPGALEAAVGNIPMRRAGEPVPEPWLASPSPSPVRWPAGVPGPGWPSASCSAPLS